MIFYIPADPCFKKRPTNPFLRTSENVPKDKFVSNKSGADKKPVQGDKA